MLKFMLLEIKKHRLTGYMKGFTIANVIMLLLLALIFYAEKSNGVIAFANFEIAFQAIHSMVRPTMIMFGAVLLVKLIVDELKTRTMSLVFMYPISRSQVMLTKIVMVIVFTFLAIVLSDLIVSTVLVALNPSIKFVPEAFNWTSALEFLVYLVPDAIAASGLVLVSLFVGLQKYSVPATLVTGLSLVIATLTKLSDLPFFMPVLGLLGFIAAYFSIQKIKHADL